MGIRILDQGSAQQGAASGRPAFRPQIAKHLQAVLADILRTLSEAAAEGTASDLERTTWHLHMACNYLKLAASETGIVEADAVDTVRDRLTDRLFLLQAALLAVGRGGAITRAQALLEGLELMVTISSLLPLEPAAVDATPPEQTDLL